MKKLNLLFVALCALTFISCEMGSSGGDSSDSESFPSNKTSYTIPSDENKITIKFPSSANGKQCYVIFSNEKSIFQLNTLDSINMNIDDTNENRTATKPEITVYEKAVKFSDGFYRDEIQFNYDELPKFNAVNLRAAGGGQATGGKANYYNDHESDESPDKNYFWILPDDLKTIKKAEFELKKKGTHCRIWLKKGDIYLSGDDLNSIQKAIDTVYEKETKIFGDNGVNGGNYGITTSANTKLDILVYDISSKDENKEEGGVFGFFRPTDFYQNEYLKTQPKASATSNECQVISIDSYFLKKDIEGIKDENGEVVQTHKVESTIIHEFQHLLNFCNKSEEYSTWFTEMLAMSAEDVFQSQINLSDNDSPKSRFAIHFDQPYYGFRNWPETNDTNVYYSYANAYAFGAYLMRNYGGIDLIKEIATNEWIDETSITNALKICGYEDETFESVFQKFGMVYINTEKNSTNSLNREVIQTFNNVQYKLSPIDLNNYPFKLFKSKQDLITYAQANLYYEGQKYWEIDSDTFALLGPAIFTTKAVKLDSIQPYGFVVYHAGQVKSGKTLTIKRKSNLSITVVLK